MKERVDVLSLHIIGGELMNVNKDLNRYLELLEVAEMIDGVDDCFIKQSKHIYDVMIIKGITTSKIFDRKLKFKAKDGTDFPDWKSDVLGNMMSIKEGTSFMTDVSPGGPYPIYNKSLNKYDADHYDFDETALICPSKTDFFFPVIVTGRYTLCEDTFAITTVNDDIGFIKALIESKSDSFVEIGKKRPLRLDDYKECGVMKPCIDELVMLKDLFYLFDKKIALEYDVLNELEKLENECR